MFHEEGCCLCPTGSPWSTACYLDFICGWQTSLLAAGGTEERDNMVPVYATTRAQCFDIVTETNSAI